MKRYMVFTTLSALMLLTIAMPDAQAALKTINLDEVSIVAANPGGAISLSPFNLGEYRESEPQYFTGWAVETATEPVIINGYWSRRFFQSTLPSGNAVQENTLIFSGDFDPSYTNTNITTKWNLQESIFNLAAGDDGMLIASVPIPAPALLLCTGLIGLIVFRRRTIAPM